MWFAPWPHSIAKRRNGQIHINPLLGGSVKNFTESVQHRKAVEYLAANDVVFRSVAYRMSVSTPEEAVLIAVECAEMLSHKIKITAPQMDVSEQEKREGYPLPKNEAERFSRNRARMAAALST
jgi:hypothetical protein